MEKPNHTIIEKVLNNRATKEEASEVIQWFNSPEGQRWLSERMDIDEHLILEGREDDLIDHAVPSIDMCNYIMRRIHQKKMRQWVFRIAAVLIPFVLFLGLFWQVNKRVDLLSVTEYDEVYVPKGERMQIMFQDGSRVYLNSESYIRYPQKFGLSERKVQLKGEGWFDVKPNSNRPFIVDVKAFNIQVLGTTFDVKAYPDEEDISVSLETGSIKLTAEVFKSIVLKPGEKVVFNRLSGRCEVTHPTDVTLSSMWKQNMLVFINASLSEVITVLDRTFNVEFTIKDRQTLNYQYTLTTSSTNLSSVLEELEKITPVRFEDHNGTISVYMDK